jgi:flavin reductase (DIM6/NTAB) family NADH-FMN oxidoreductase RutF
MNIDILGKDSSRAYQLLASVVVPRPIAFVTSLDIEGRINAAPFSFFNLLGSNPPILGINIADLEDGSPKHTRANILSTKEFVVNLVHGDLAEAMNICGVDFPADVNELEPAGLTPIDSVKVKAPGIAQSRVQLECVLADVVHIGGNHVVIGKIVYLHIADEFMDKERMRVNTPDLDLVGRMHGRGWYARTSDLFEMPRLSVEDVAFRHL